MIIKNKSNLPLRSLHLSSNRSNQKKKKIRSKLIEQTSKEKNGGNKLDLPLRTSYAWLPMLVRRETDHVRMELDSDSTFYSILFRIRIRIQIFSDTNTKQ